MNQEIVVSRNGFWPHPWRWNATVDLSTPTGSRHHMSGDAWTENQAWKRARVACESITFEFEPVVIEQLRAA